MINPNWPNEVRGEGDGVPWLNKLLRGIKKTWLKDVVFVGGSAKLIPSTDGQTLVLSSVPAQTSEVMFPFKLYNIGNTEDSTKSPFTYQVRGAYVGCRLRYWQSTFFSDPPHAISNFEQVLLFNGTDGFAGDAQPTQNPYTVAILNVGDTQVDQSTFDDLVGYVQLVQNTTSDDLGEVCSSFWAEVNDINNPAPIPDGGAFVALKCRMWTRNPADSTGRTTEVFPTGAPNIYPIGFVRNLANGTPIDFKQLTMGHIFNQYNGDSLGFATTSRGQNLGKWTDIITTSGGGMLFYNGDTVIDDTVDVTKNVTVTPSSGTATGNFKFKAIYTYMGGFNYETVAPNLNPTVWKYVGVYLVP